MREDTWNVIPFLKIIIAYVIVSLIFSGAFYYHNTNLHSWDNKVSADVTRTDGTTEHYNSGVMSLLYKGDVVELTVNLPEQEMVPDSSLCFYVYHSVVHAYAGDKLIYSYGDDIAQKGRMIGAVYPRIEIPNDLWGQQMRIELIVEEDAAYSRIVSLSVIPSNNSYMYFLGQNVTTYFVYTAAFVLGLLILVYLLLSFKNTPEIRRGIYIDLFLIIASVWIMSNNGMLNLLSGEAHVLAYLEYISITLMAAPLLLYVYECESRTMSKKIMLIAAIFSLVEAIVLWILNMTTSLHYANTLPIFHITALIDMILILQYAFAGSRRKDKEADIVLFGIAIAGIFTFVDIIRYFLERFLQIRGRFMNKTLVPVGVMILIATLVVSYGIWLEKKKRG